IYPNTLLARTALEAGLIESEEDLLFPKFYIAREVEGWLEQTVDAWMEGRPNWIK
ncbi:MAG: B12-binding domain-containing radical SAM protein, partial [Deltaproteobacteria bacterium]|nr:B12-binding domain-containing radical SAM protein [Deltaproteobacteria bacterium]